jgi:hypothetical protein
MLMLFLKCGKLSKTNKISLAGAGPSIALTQVDVANTTAAELSRIAASDADNVTKVEILVAKASAVYKFTKKLVSLCKKDNHQQSKEHLKVLSDLRSMPGTTTEDNLLTFFPRSGKGPYQKEYVEYLKTRGKIEHAHDDLDTVTGFLNEALASLKEASLWLEKAKHVAAGSKEAASIALAHAASLVGGLQTIDYILIGIGGTVTVTALLGIVYRFYPGVFGWNTRNNQDFSLDVNQIVFESPLDSAGVCTGKWLWNKTWELFGYHNLDAQNALIALELQKAEEARVLQLALAKAAAIKAAAIKTALAKEAVALALFTLWSNVIGLLFFTLAFDSILLLIYYEVVVKDKF